MIKYFVVQGGTNIVLAALDALPEHIPEGYSVVKYNGYVPIKYLECKNGAIVSKGDAPTQDPVLEQQRAQAIKAITDTATKLLQQARCDCTYNIIGYQEVFEEKVNQAYDMLTSSPLDQADKFPLIQSESLATGVPPRDVASSVLYNKSKWMAKASSIDQFMLTGMYGIANATTNQQIQSIKNQILTELLRLY